ncbi:hypothetical protein DDE19_34315 [Micromonospora ureilytica]|uniref:Uncharacterized protein n=1 Tax=Micromonospora ureilytica TaxID=709868 RepID=A0A3N9X748_9ACTN|nr:hypothetical protein [Micromonospora ureilytica]RQX08802.1 hypothetical protein DDE19_34315 [Micromonospora ureilytica]
MPDIQVLPTDHAPQPPALTAAGTARVVAVASGRDPAWRIRWDDVQFQRGYGSSATGPSMPEDNNYSWQPAAPEFQHTDSSNNLADISYTTQQTNSLNITADNWQRSKVAGVPSSVATPAPQTELNPKTDREPTPEPRPRKRRHRR